MSLWLQNLVVILAVAGCVAFTVWQAVRALHGKRSRVGSCCAKGCSNDQPTKDQSRKIVFLPAEMLGRKK